MQENLWTERRMGSESKNKNGDGAGPLQGCILAMVQNLKEIVNCRDFTDNEIYFVLRECEMDPNRAVERLLTQDTFHEVKSKRERRKEMKEAIDSRSRGNKVNLSRGSRTSSERNVMQSGPSHDVMQSGPSHASYNEHGKTLEKVEAGSVCPSISSSTTPVLRKNTNSGSLSSDKDGRPSLQTSDSISASAHVSRGLKPAWQGVSKGHLSMADIVRMGKPHMNSDLLDETCYASQDNARQYHQKVSEVSLSANTESSFSIHSQNQSDQHILHGEWPVEHPTTGNMTYPSNISQSLNVNIPSAHYNMRGTMVSLVGNSESDMAKVLKRDVASENVNYGRSESSSISRGHAVMVSAGLASYSNCDLKNTDSSDSYSSYEHYEGAGSSSQLSHSNHSETLTSDAVVDVSSAASHFQLLSLRNTKVDVPSTEDNHAVVLPSHLQALAADCSHLSFGTYNRGSNSASSVTLPSNISVGGWEEKVASVGSSLANNPLYYGDKQPGFDVLRDTDGNNGYELLASTRQELVNHVTSEAILEREYTAMSSAPDLNVQKSLWMNPLSPFKRQGLQSGNPYSSSRDMHADSNFTHGDVLSTRMTSRNSDLLQSSLFMSQSHPARHNNAVSSIGNPVISMGEVMEPGGFAASRRSAVPQDLSMQSSLRPELLADMRGYHSLSQNYPYMTSINSHQEFSGSAAHNQSPADMNYNLVQNRNEIFKSRVPPARDSFGYGNLVSSYNTGSFLPNPSLGPMMTPSNYDEILPSQYSGGHNLNRIQPHGGFPTWDYGPESRSLSLPENTHYGFLGQESQASQYATSAYSDLYNSQTRDLAALQRQVGSRDWSSKQSHQFWPQNH